MADPGTGVHVALPYDDRGRYVDAMLAFSREAIAAGAPVAVAVSGPMADLLKPTDLGQYAGVTFHDHAALALNPARLIAAMWDLVNAHPGERVWWIEEPALAGRGQAADAETIRHEALVGLAFADLPVSVLCLYDRQQLGAFLLDRVPLTHAQVWSGGQPGRNASYLGPGVMPPGCDQPLPTPPPDAEQLAFGWDLAPVRRAVTAVAGRAGLDADRSTDLMLAVSEAAANSLRHGGGSGLLHSWVTRDEVICQVEDGGTITDPLAGRRRAERDTDGHGLWVINQMCDLVELRSRPGRTTARLHLSR